MTNSIIFVNKAPAATFTEGGVLTPSDWETYLILVPKWLLRAEISLG